MSEIKKIEKTVMEKIHKGDLKMKPRIYFILGSILSFLGLVSTIIVSTISVGLTRFLFRTNFGHRAQYKLEFMLNEFPWWIMIVAILGLVIGIWLIRKYNFSYKIKPVVLVLGFVLAIIIAGWFIDLIGINDILLHKGPMREMMRGYMRSP